MEKQTVEKYLTACVETFSCFLPLENIGNVALGLIPPLSTFLNIKPSAEPMPLFIRCLITAVRCRAAASV